MEFLRRLGGGWIKREPEENSMNDPVKCSRCPAQIRFVTMAKSGKPNPLDATPAENGNVWIDEEGKGHTITKGEEYVASRGPLYISHFATCPAAQHFRKK